MKRLPPYARGLPGALNRQTAPEVTVLVGADAWHSAKFHNAKLVLPPGEDVGAFRWPVHDVDVLVIQKGPFPAEQFPRFAYLLLTAGANAVRVLPEDSGLIVYHKTLARAAA